MSYAVRNDGLGWHAVLNESDVGPDEWYSVDQPPPTEPPPPTTAEIAAAARGERDRRLTVAANRMGPLEDAIDEESATADEIARLKLWKQYRITLNRIDQQPGFPISIQWPKSPDETP